MKANLLTHAMGALLISIGVAACGQQGTGREEAQAPYVAPEATTTPGQQQPLETTTPTDPYASTADPNATTTDPNAIGSQTDQSGSLTGNTDISGAQTTGDTLGDRCAGLSGPALTDCLETERLRRQDVQDPTQTQQQDVPEQ